MKRSKYFLVIIIIVILVLAFTLASQQQKTSVAGNKQLLSEALTLLDLSIDNKTTVGMLENFKQKVDGDSFAEDLINEAIWLQRFGEYHHAGHSLTFLALYIKDGSKYLCPGHEIEHVELFVKHNNFDLLDETIQNVEDSYQQWKEDVYAKKAKSPAYYTNLDDVVKTMDIALAKIKAGNYNISTEVEFLTENDVCA